MADISDVNSTQIKELYQSLESLSCKIPPIPTELCSSPPFNKSPPY